jgi:hypothetical protein
MYTTKNYIVLHYDLDICNEMQLNPVIAVFSFNRLDDLRNDKFINDQCSLKGTYQKVFGSLKDLQVYIIKNKLASLYYITNNLFKDVDIRINFISRTSNLNNFFYEG